MASTPASNHPLAVFPVFDTVHVEQAEEKISQDITSGLQIGRVENARDFRLQMAGTPVGGSTLFFNRFGTLTELTAGQIEGTAVVAVGGQEPSVFQIDGESVEVSARSAAVVGPGRRVRISRPASSGLIGLRVDLARLERRYRELTGRTPPKVWDFDKRVDLSTGPGLRLRQTLDYAIQQLEGDPALLSVKSLRLNMDDLLLGCFLFIPGEHTADLVSSPGMEIAPGRVRRAEEYMRAFYHEPISIADLAAIGHCSESALFEAFKDVRGFTPMQFLQEIRLEGARWRLQNPDPTTSVTSVVNDCGFRQPGRFSVSYRKRFGERPSDTLRKARARSFF